MALEWTPQQGHPDLLKAIGTRGEYRLRRIGFRWLLGATGHDRLPMMQLPAEGRMFIFKTEAESCADGIDRAPCEAEMSGC